MYGRDRPLSNKLVASERTQCTELVHMVPREICITLEMRLWVRWVVWLTGLGKLF